eukprot:CAMPEP_0185854578 /NCGR_PEP_ID=MMETSP1354-20130828/22846_1 /TAXON_ID=708628 /ORGANISM="Erythrolobus madagascarensis, Strain CCMP3276" /LENGTH=62 /DNA_ID=CAMNT_0028556377 /DNA_START=1 /DNA_END=185 /DNA_ORIENTATION=+
MVRLCFRAGFERHVMRLVEDPLVAAPSAADTSGILKRRGAAQGFPSLKTSARYVSARQGGGG